MVTQKKKFVLSRLFMIGAVLFTVLVILGFFRFQASRLEQHLSNLDKDIERYSAEEVELKQVFSGLASPIKIYGYCKDMLGMDKVKHVEMVRIPAAHVAVVPAPEPQKKWRSNVFSLLGFTVN